jgi:hypothetical protein
LAQKASYPPWTISDSQQVRAFAFTPAELTVLKMIEIMERAKSVGSDDHAFRGG